jgi:hypothetical protein
MAADRAATRRQQTVHLGEVRIILTEDCRGRIEAVRIDRHGTAIKRAQL